MFKTPIVVDKAVKEFISCHLEQYVSSFKSVIRQRCTRVPLEVLESCMGISLVVLESCMTISLVVFESCIKCRLSSL